jgi:hypothetical protein
MFATIKWMRALQLLLLIWLTKVAYSLHVAGTPHPLTEPPYSCSDSGSGCGTGLGLGSDTGVGASGIVNKKNAPAAITAASS